jgi:hypothetical protein
MRSVPRCYKQNKSRILLLGKQLPACMGVNTAAEEATVLEVVTRQRLVKRQQTEKA